VTAGRLFAMLAAFLVVGVPIVAVLWHSVNEVSSGDLGRLALAISLALAFAAFLVFFGRSIHRLERER
jgi:hypothetical protein